MTKKVYQPSTRGTPTTTKRANDKKVKKGKTKFQMTKTANKGGSKQREIH